MVGPDVTLVDSATEVAREVSRMLEEAKLLRPGRRSPDRVYYVSDQVEKFRRSGNRFLGEAVSRVELRRVWEEYAENKRYL